MSTDIDFTSLKSANPNERSLVDGYIRNQFKQYANASTKNIINYTILAFYRDNTDTFSTFIPNYDLSSDRKCISGCGYGKYEIDPNNTEYNRYQWMIKISQCNYAHDGCTLGITSYADTQTPWCYNEDITQYSFNNAPFPGYTNTIFETGDILILDLNLSTKQFSLFVNGKFGGFHKNINTQRGIKYRLACIVFQGINYVTIEKFTKFKCDDYRSMSRQKKIKRKMVEGARSPSKRYTSLTYMASKNKNDLFHYDPDLVPRAHPNGYHFIDYNELWRIRGKPPADSVAFRSLNASDKWEIRYFGLLDKQFHLEYA